MKLSSHLATFPLMCALVVPVSAEECPVLRSIALPQEQMAGKDKEPIALLAGEGIVALRAGVTTVNVDGSARAYHPEGGYASLCNAYNVWLPGKRLVCANHCDTCDPLFQQALRGQEPPFSGDTQFRLFGFEGKEGLANPEGQGGHLIGRRAGGQKDGIPTVQVHGYYVSTTAITLAGGEGQKKYLSSELVPSIVMPRAWSQRFPEAAYELGDLVYVFDPGNPRHGTAGIVGDTGPGESFGEASLAMHSRLYGREWVEPPLPGVNGHTREDCDALLPPLTCTESKRRKVRATINYDAPLIYVVFPSTRPACMRADNSGCQPSEFSKDTLDERVNAVIRRQYGDRVRMHTCLIQAFR